MPLVNGFLISEGGFSPQPSDQLIGKNRENLVAGRIYQKRKALILKGRLQPGCQPVGVSAKLQIKIIFKKLLELNTENTSLGKKAAALL